MHTHAHTRTHTHTLSLALSLSLSLSLSQVNPDIVYVCDPVLGDHGKLYVPAGAVKQELDQLTMCRCCSGQLVSHVHATPCRLDPC